MSIEKVRAAFAAQGIADRIRELDESSATVALAAQALGCETVFPACGSSNSAIELTLPELERYSGALGWVHVCKDVP